jgi:hypothetical protein
MGTYTTPERSRPPELTVNVVFSPVVNGRPQPELPDFAAAGDAATNSPATAASAAPHFVQRAARADAMTPDITIPLVKDKAQSLEPREAGAPDAEA